MGQVDMPAWRMQLWQRLDVLPGLVYEKTIVPDDVEVIVVD